MSASASVARCAHCAEPITSGAGGFSCTGCAVVHQLLADAGLDRYYESAS